MQMKARKKYISEKHTNQKEKNMKVKKLIIIGMMAAVLAPLGAMADGLDLTTTKDADGNLVFQSSETNEAYKAFTEMRTQNEAKAKQDEEKEKQRLKCINSMDERGNTTHRWLLVDEGVCISKNPCTSKVASEKKYCNDTFKKVQVMTPNTAANIVLAYAKNTLKWNSCVDLQVPKKGAKSGQDYLECTNPENGDFRMFEFDDVSESKAVLARNNEIYALCIAGGGKTAFPKKREERVECTGVTEQYCTETIGGGFAGGKCIRNI
jgi:hypothetical protein